MLGCLQRGAKGASTDSDEIPTDASTRSFIDIVCSSPHVVAVLCGHVQQPHSIPIGAADCVQYVTSAGYKGDYRWIDIVPLTNVVKL